jgi:hypothetical protein
MHLPEFVLKFSADSLVVRACSQPGPPGLTSQATGSNTQRNAPGATEGRHSGSAAPYNEAGRETAT